MNSKTCNIQIDELAFTFKVEANVSEEIKIKQQAAEIAGGMDNLISLETIVDRYRSQMYAHNRERFGDDYEAVEALVKNDQEKEFTQEEQEKRIDFLRNEFTKKYLIAQTELSQIKDFATLIVLCVKKPPDFNLLTAKSDTISKLITEYKKQTEFFRKPEEKTVKAD